MLGMNAQELLQLVTADGEVSPEDQATMRARVRTAVLQVNKQIKEMQKSEEPEPRHEEEREDTARRAEEKKRKELRELIRKAGVRGAMVSLEHWKHTGDGIRKNGKNGYCIYKTVSSHKGNEGGKITWGNYKTKAEADEAAIEMNKAAQEEIQEEYRATKRRRIEVQEGKRDLRPP